MPVINVKMTNEDGGATVEQKEELVKGINEFLARYLIDLAQMQ